MWASGECPLVPAVRETGNERRPGAGVSGAARGGRTYMRPIAWNQTASTSTTTKTTAVSGMPIRMASLLE